MGVLNELIKNLVVCVIVINIVDCLIISKQYSKYIKLFTGILVIIVVLNASEGVVKKLAKQSIIDEKNGVINGTNWDSYKDKNIEQANASINNIQKEINKKYKEEIVQKLEKEHIVKVDTIRIKENRENVAYKIVLYLKVLDTRRINEEYEDTVYNIISYYYDIGKEDVKIRFV